VGGERGVAGSTKKTLHVLAGTPVKSLGVIFPSLPAMPRPRHLIFKCEKGNWRRAPLGPPVESSGISQRAPTRSTRCRTSACLGGDARQLTRTGVDLVLHSRSHTFSLSLSPSLSQTHTNTALSHEEAATLYAVTCFFVFFSHIL